VRETQRAVRDGRTGQESITLRRGLGERERTVTRTRDASGRETADDILKGIAAEEAAAFDREWAERASKLPAAGAFGFGGAGAGGRLGTGGAGRLAGGGGAGGMDGGAQRSSGRPLALTGSQPGSSRGSVSGRYA